MPIGKIRNLAVFTISLAFFGSASVFADITVGESAAPLSTSSVVINKGDFDSQTLLAPEYRSNSASSLSFLSPNRFSMRQSYSLSVTAGGAGSMSSGLYLNTLSYRLANPLTLSMDMGFYTPIHSSIPGMGQNTLLSQGTGSSFVLPRMGLEYKPSDRFSLNLEIINGQDAWKAYGSPYGSSLWSRFP